MAHLTGKTVAFLATDGYEDSELTSPWEAVIEHGAQAVLVAPKAGTIKGKKGHEAQVERDRRPRGSEPLRRAGAAGRRRERRPPSAGRRRRRVRPGVLLDGHKPVGVICHGGWILTDADVVRGRTLTSYPSLKTDLRNAGATWLDPEVVVDAGLVSSRTPADLPAFNAKLVEEIAEGAHGGRLREWRSRRRADGSSGCAARCP